MSCLVALLLVLNLLARIAVVANQLVAGITCVDKAWSKLVAVDVTGF